MNPSDYRICLDVQAPHGAVELDAKQGDSQRRIFITLTDGGVPYGIAEDCRPLLTAKKPDGTVLYNLCSVEQNTAIYQLTRQTTACPGRVRCELRLYSSELTLDEEGKPSADSAQLLTAATFTLLVHPQVCSDEDAIASLPESTQLEQLVSDTQALLTHVQTKLEQGDFVGEKGDQGEKGDKGEKGDRGEKGDPGEVNIDDGQVSEEATWSSMQISAEISDCVGYYPQNKANSQKAQARENIGALGHTITKPVRISNGDQDAVILTAQTIFDQDSLMADVLTLQGDRDGQIDTDAVVLRGLHEGIKDTDAVNKGQLDKAELTMVNKLCPSFTETGAVVTCEPVEGYPLTVTAEDGATITRCGKNLINPTAYITASPSTSTLAGDVFTSNFQNGALYINSHTAQKVTHPKGTYTATFFPVTEGAVCSFFVYSAATGALLTTKYDLKAEKPSMTFTVEEDFRFAVGGAKPYGMQSYRLQLEAGSKSTGYAPYQGNTFAPGAQIPSLPGVNTLYSNIGDTTVSGKANPAGEIEKLKNAILSLGGNL